MERKASRAKVQERGKGRDPESEPELDPAPFPHARLLGSSV
jgi:hypothetical protein